MRQMCRYSTRQGPNWLKSVSISAGQGSRPRLAATSGSRVRAPGAIWTRHNPYGAARCIGCVFSRGPAPGSFHSTRSDSAGGLFSDRAFLRHSDLWQHAFSNASASLSSTPSAGPGTHTTGKILFSHLRSWPAPVLSVHFFFARSQPTVGTFRSISTSFNASLWFSNSIRVIASDNCLSRSWRWLSEG